MIVNTILPGNSAETLRALPDCSVDCCVTSPPYYGLRDYGVDGQIGLEETPEEYIKKLVAVFHEVRRVLNNEGTLWVNIGDTYAGSGNGAAHYPDTTIGRIQGTNRGIVDKPNLPQGKVPKGYKAKDLVGIPWMLAFALRADGWYLRQDIIWHKPNPMPESVNDRCTKSHEYLFLLSKSPRYYFDNKAIQEIAAYDGRKDTRMKGSHKYSKKGVFPRNAPQTFAARGHERWQTDEEGNYLRNKRDVWIINTKPTPYAHFAVFPEKLVLPCILSGCPENGIVLDPFLGSGTTAIVAMKLLRKYVGCELNPDYIKIAEQRIANEKGLWNE
jgi:DNA modification methylase